MTLDERDPTVARAHALSLLNACNVDWLWQLCCVCSCHDMFGPDLPDGENSLFINFARVRGFTELILAGTASTEKTGRLDSEELRRLLNDIVNIDLDEDALAELSAANATANAEWEFHRYLIRLGGTQIADQAIRFNVNVGRQIGMWETLLDESPHFIPERERPRVAGVHKQAVELLGAPISDLALVASFVYRFYYDRYATIGRALPIVPSEKTVTERARRQALGILLEMLQSLSFRDDWTFSAQELAQLTSLEIATVEAYLRRFARTTEELRRLRRQARVLSTGHFSRELSILDRFSLVRLESGRYVVPNIRLLLRSFVPGIDYFLLERIGEGYSHARGALQEAYLRRLLEERFGHSAVVVSERTYGKLQQAGPDLVVAAKDGSGLVVLESKSRRVAASTRFVLSRELFESNLGVAYEALLKLPKKIAALHQGLKEYRDVQALLDASRRIDPICVVVMSDSLMRMSELVRLQMRQDSEHKLSGFLYRFCILGIESFEWAVELAVSKGCSLHSVLAEHWEKSGSSTAMEASADRFGDIASSSTSFAATFMRKAFKAKSSDPAASPRTKESHQGD